MTTHHKLADFDAVIFDMDGLLVDSERVWHMAEDAFIRSFGHEYTDDVREQIVGLRMDEFLTVLKRHYDLAPSVPELSAMLEARVLKLIETEVHPQPGARDMIDAVIAAGLPYGIASSSGGRVIDATLKSQGWDDLFAVRCTADDDANGKPAPDVYLRAARVLGVAPERCLALEDSPNGARAAVAAGMTCYAVPDTSHTSPAAFDGITPHVYCTLREVIADLSA